MYNMHMCVYVCVYVKKTVHEEGYMWYIVFFLCLKTD